MATFVFENMTQAQADAVTAADIIAVATTSANARNVGVAIATQVGVDVITLTVGTKSLTFNAATLSTISTAGNIVFNDASHLELGTNGADSFDGVAGAPGTTFLFGGNDSFLGTTNNNEDFVFGMGGNDTIVGGSTASHLYGFNASGGTDGNDSLLGGGAGDYLQGNSGTDSLDGGAGSDRILGGAGNDTVSGSAGNDSLNGNTGNDTLDGGADNDLVRGGQGNDSVSGGADNDQLFGDLGTDTLDGGAGIDSFTGGAGNDIINFFGSNGTGATTVSTGTTVFYDTVLDWTDGEDEFRIGTTSALTTQFGDETGDLLIGAAGATFTTVSAATVYAQQLLDAGTSGDDLAVVKVGNDVFLFWDSTGVQGTAIDSIVKLQGVTDTSLFTIADFG